MLPSCLDQDYVISCLGKVHSTIAATSYDEANVENHCFHKAYFQVRNQMEYDATLASVPSSHME